VANLAFFSFWLEEINMRTRLLNIFLVLVITLSAAYAQADVASDIQAGNLSLQEVVEKALDEELSAAEIVTQLIAAGVNPVLAAEFVAIAKPSAAAEIAKAAAIAVPEAAVEIAGTVAQAVPEAAAEIAGAVAQAVPEAAAEIASVVAQAVPDAAAEIAGTVAEAVPEAAVEIADAVAQEIAPIAEVGITKPAAVIGGAGTIVVCIIIALILTCQTVDAPTISPSQ